MCLDTVLQKDSFLAKTAISLGICSPALPLFLLCLLASPSFPLLTGLLPAVCIYSQVPTIMGTFFLFSALLLIHQVGKTPGLSSLGSIAKKHQHDGTESRGEYPIGMNCPTDVNACVHSHIHSFPHYFIHSSR